MVPKIDSYIQDTPDILRHFEDLKTKTFPPQTFPVSIDVVALYPSIPHNEAIEAMREALEERPDKTVPTEFLIELLNHILKSNTFEFDKDLFVQLVGTAIGAGAASTIANCL